MPSKVGAKGQVVIEKQLRDRLGVEPGSLAVQRLVDGHLEIYFIPPPHTRSLFGSLAPYLDNDLAEELAHRDWNEIREEAWRRATEERSSGEDRSDDDRPA